MNAIMFRKTAPLATAAALLLAPMAGAVSIVVSVDPAGPVQIGDQFDVNLSVTGWNGSA